MQVKIPNETDRCAMSIIKLTLLFRQITLNTYTTAWIKGQFFRHVRERYYNAKSLVLDPLLQFLHSVFSVVVP